jgi:hypothetical protein
VSDNTTYLVPLSSKTSKIIILAPGHPMLLHLPFSLEKEMKVAT